MLVRGARVTGVLPTIVVAGVLAGVLAGWAILWAIRDRPVQGIQIPGMVVVEVGLVVQTVIAAAAMAAGTGPDDPALVWGYLVTTLLLVPVAFGWAFVERTRWSSVVLAVACAVVVVLQVRIWQIWVG